VQLVSANPALAVIDRSHCGDAEESSSRYQLGGVGPEGRFPTLAIGASAVALRRKRGRIGKRLGRLR
jgi:hypothetical protein